MSSSNRTNSDRAVAAIVLAAGKGKRMKSDLPKVAHMVAGKPIVTWVLQAITKVDAKPIVVVIGHGSDEVQVALKPLGNQITFVTQEEQLGTAHATQCAAPVLKNFTGDVFVLAGDGPLIRASTLSSMIDHHRQTNAAATIATARLDDPTGYGRVVRNADGSFDRIVEHKHTTEKEKAISEVYPSYAIFKSELLFKTLESVKTNRESGEYYITDIFELLKREGNRVEIVDEVPAEDILSVNTPEQLAQVDAILRERMSGQTQPQTTETHL